MLVNFISRVDTISCYLVKNRHNLFCDGNIGEIYNVMIIILVITRFAAQ